MNKEQETQHKRKPAAFSVDDPKVVVSDELIDEPEELSQSDLQNSPRSANGFGWFSVFLSAIGGLILLGITVWLTSFVTALLFRQDWIGWLSLALIAVAGFAGLMLMVREVVGLVKLKRQGELKHRAELAIADKDLVQSKKVVRGIKTLLSGREELRWGFTRFKEQSRDVLDADELLILVEREVIADVDARARELIAASARRVAVVTTLSPAAVVDVAYVAFENLSLLRRIAILYGGRPGLYGLMRLGRMVLTHLTVTGGLALTADMLQQFLGQRIAAKVSAKLGEGLFNGTLTARIGLAAVDICRPLPFMRSKKPTIRELVGVLVSGIVKQ